MQDKDWIEVHETAFVTSMYRASNEGLSKDTYAKLWSNPKTYKWIEGFLEHVSEEEPYAHCLRNRYFYEFVKANNNIEVVINFGCGFSMYPFLLDDHLIHIEIDLPNIIEHKKAKVNDWTASGDLPKRNIHYISSDFSSRYEGELLRKIHSITNHKRSLIILEGVLFFLNMEQTKRLFRFFNAIQTKGDYIGSVSFQDSIRTTEVFERLVNFFQDKTEENREFICQTLPDSFYETISDYNLIEHQDYYSLSKAYAPNKITKKPKDVLNEHVYILRKIE
ncbi:class I SAM-dependent methyltransferase [Winogradskyella sp. 3972H.M.0a.05]|uniref:class I SAM-dependent methyltransferase n=1 Tax=Winogradskyella sp. 3972H.M.0a.05 TaxID=2950277 RepID=UPI003392F1CC